MAKSRVPTTVPAALPGATGTNRVMALTCWPGQPGSHAPEAVTTRDLAEINWMEFKDVVPAKVALLDDVAFDDGTVGAQGDDAVALDL